MMRFYFLEILLTFNTVKVRFGNAYEHLLTSVEVVQKMLFYIDFLVCCLVLHFLFSLPEEIPESQCLWAMSFQR